ncbi:hypothetical protein TWF481_009218 [Arthrobotrys musiformis]|uniref:Uncharacterized protein n=1 Tax=Arthrobotrys musiformis TaxID=47236 RepID=A0AAV9W305_9PEZI
MSRPTMKPQKKGEPTKATFERFHKWAADVNVVYKGKKYKKPHLGTGLSVKPYPPKTLKFNLKAVKGKRRRVKVQDDSTVTGEYPLEDKNWYDVLADESDNSDYFNEPWYCRSDTRAREKFLNNYKLRLFPDPEEADIEFQYICLAIRDGIECGYPILPIMEKYVREGFRRRNRVTYFQWAMNHKLMIYAHIFWFSLYITPIIWYFIFYPPDGIIKTDHGWVWPATPLPAPADNGITLPVRFWPKHDKERVGWSTETLQAYALFFALNFLLIFAKLCAQCCW